MKNKNELRKFISFQLNECEAIKEYLEEMALKGWKLKYIRTLFFYFEKIEPQRLYYSVEVFTKASIFDMIPANSTEEFIDYCHEAGWDFVCNMGQVNIFVSESEKTIPIETDENLKLKTIIKGFIKQNGLLWFVAFPLLFIMSLLYFTYFEFIIASYIGLIGILFFIILSIILFFQVGGFIIWIAKQKRRLKNGEQIKSLSLKKQKVRIKSSMIFLVTMLVVFIPASVQAAIQHDYVTAITAIICAMVISAILLFSHHLHKSLQKGRFNRKKNIVIIILCALSMIALSYFSGYILGVFIAKSENLFPNNVVNFQTSWASLVIYDHTFSSTIKDTYDLPNDEETLTITVFKSRYGFIIDHYLHLVTHLKTYEENIKPVWYEENIQAEWGAKTMHISRDRIYIAYDDCVISFASFAPLTKAIVEEILQTYHQ